MKNYGSTLSKAAYSKSLAIQVCSQVLSACSWLHARQWSHGDIKPANIMVRDGTVVLIDYGSVLFSSSFSLESQRCTLYYVSPEELVHKRAGPATDIWSLGATLFEFSTDSFFIVKLMAFMQDQGTANSISNLKSFYSHLMYGSILKFLYKTIKDRDLLGILAHCFILEVKDRPTANHFLSKYEIFKDQSHLVAAEPELPPFLAEQGLTFNLYERQTILSKMATVLSSLAVINEQKDIFMHSLALFDRYIKHLPTVTEESIQVGISSSCLISCLLFKGEGIGTTIKEFIDTLKFQFLTLYPSLWAGRNVEFEEYLKLVSTTTSNGALNKLISTMEKV